MEIRANSNNSTKEGKDKPPSCSTCLLTGSATCFGVSLYCIYHAYPIVPPTPTLPVPSSKAFDRVSAVRFLDPFFRPAVGRHSGNNRNFLLGMAVTWAAAGFYRIYLGP
mmetsp:Transcript_38000/g.88418  ORF Transcript_38000/g.88418 Transcript_38000/m.88418 type:complete len:109 (-) Transcript_38000:489-815(-)